MLLRQWRIQMLGRLSVRSADREAERFRTRKCALLLAYLAYHPHRNHARDALVELLWPDADLDNGRQSLRQALATLRAMLEPPGVPRGAVLGADRTSVRLRSGTFSCDVHDFNEALHKAAHASLRAEQGLHLAQADLGYAGELLPGYYEEWVVGERDRLRELHLATLATLAEIESDRGANAAALDYTLRLLACDRTREDAHVLAIRLYAATGRLEDARRQFAFLKQALYEDLGVSPSPAAYRLLERLDIQTASPPLTPSHPTATSASPTLSMSLPKRTLALPLTPGDFHGRGEELSTLYSVLEFHTARCVVLSGSGGVGKTRLAIEAARAAAAHYAFGAYFVPVTVLPDSEALLQAIARALNIELPLHKTPLAALVERFGRSPTGAHVLIILDALEHITEPCHTEIRALLSCVPSVTLLITSRRLPGIPGEFHLPVSPLPVPKPPSLGEQQDTLDPEALMEFAGIRLLVDRMQASAPDFQLTARNAGVIAQLAARLEGIPLAIELAATWAGALPPARMLTRMDARLDFLKSRHSDLSPRYLSLRASMDWSYQLLSEPTQRLFRFLSIFRGGCTLEAACTVSRMGRANTEQSLQELLTHSMLTTGPATAPTMRRYLQLDSLREFGEEQLDSATKEHVRRTHAAYYLGLARPGALKAVTARKSEHYGLEPLSLNAEVENFRAVTVWCLEHQRMSTAARLAVSLSNYRQVWGHWSESREVLDQSLEFLDRLPAGLGARVLLAAGDLAHRCGDLGRARLFSDAAVQRFQTLGNRRALCRGLIILGAVHLVRDDYPAALQAAETALELLLDDTNSLAKQLTLFRLGEIAIHQSRYTDAQFHLETGLHQMTSGQPMEANFLVELASLDLCRGHFVEADLRLERALTIHQADGHAANAAWTQSKIGMCSLLQGEGGKARALLTEVLTGYRSVGDRRHLVFVQRDLARALLQEGNVGFAEMLLEEAWTGAENVQNRRCMAVAASGRAELALIQGDTKMAMHACTHALDLCTSMGDSRMLAETLLLAARALTSHRAYDRAAVLAAIAARIRSEIGAPLPPIEQPILHSLTAELEIAVGSEGIRSATEISFCLSPDQYSAFVLSV